MSLKYKVKEITFINACSLNFVEVYHSSEKITAVESASQFVFPFR